MPHYFVCRPEYDYEMFHDGRYALDSFNRNVIEAPDVEQAILKFYDGELPRLHTDIFVVELAWPRAAYVSPCILENKKEESREIMEKRKLLEKLKRELGEV